MRYSYIRPFMEAARDILEQMLPGGVVTGDVCLAPPSIVSRGVVSIVGITGETQGRVLFDMAPEAALAIAGAMNGETLSELGSLGQDTLSELASMIAGRAVSILNDEGHRLKSSPPTLLMGERLTISNTELETLVVPVRTSCGEVVVNVAITTS